MKRYLSLSDFAERTGLSANTISSYTRKCLTPPADVVIGLKDHAVRGWSEETIDLWLANRPGRGARTDLKRAPQ